MISPLRSRRFLIGYKADCDVSTSHRLEGPGHDKKGVGFPGHLGMRHGQTTAGTGDEQPLEALALIRAHARSWELTGDHWFRDRATHTHSWFNGRNRLGVAVADDDGGCFDGLSAHGVNRNQGAESTLAYVSSALTVERIHRTVVTPLGSGAVGAKVPVGSSFAGQ